MRFYLKTLLPYLLMLFVNYFVVKWAFIGMTYPNDFTFMMGMLALGALLVADATFIMTRLKRHASAEPTPTVPPTE